ncbi:MAG TPA: DUF2249 domain-containing protein [Gammaproteobacteria bacterium]|nr:DUF2249 domain-containing protein [Gammaproteobacteria bacterium]
MNEAESADPTALQVLNRQLLRALLALGKCGAPQRDTACSIAAVAWSVLRHTHAREAERLNGVLHALTQSTHPKVNEEITMSEAKILDVRSLIPMERHRKIFETYEHLGTGDRFVLVNDHDPKPLYYQFEAEHTGKFSWKYLEQGPTAWRVEIGRTAAE